ncbi:hypothetical protein DRF60_04250 [Chryseobacterium elymi]|uniref:Uncharacterized protein n=1 Tax=Chryseobacterium elymi TaxID=395936 RepID=A0A3D9DNL4_9FLAO|nr:hypothetical protein [Chryseobacterium elymi]REC79630.1 hypothetical protein DRF60_04250 [Chryseobacterium elymi]
MRKVIFFVGILSSQIFFSQIGFNTPSPNATLDIISKTTDGSKPEGLNAPRLTGDQIRAADAQYNTDQTGMLIYATAAATVMSAKTININSEGYYYFDGSIWQKIINRNVSIYNSDETLQNNRTVDMEDKILNFVSNAVTGPSHFQVDGNTFSVDAVNNRIGSGTSTPTTKLQISNGAIPGAIRIVDGTQAEGKIFVSDFNGVGTWRENTGPGATVVIDSNVGPATSLLPAGTMRYVGTNATVTIPGYYVITTRLITDKSPLNCGEFIAFNLSQSPTTALKNAFPNQDIHLSAGYIGFDFVYTSNIAYLEPGTYYLRARISGGCTSNVTRSNFGQNSFTLTLLK